ncbi:MAG: bifunctional diaminohydroxyphosphoribosylaminopyrimidine deaminase/5-amino-6-(5-phosphoribosylamino)uracil reductase RibD [Alphaproteobacteria bacterium]|nr:bifunctional diaminohydroxyphosphoribosylaminopyrimidine deaminase/5-amino-6-(5-phosphoribosylamino)uracil reductase RibD [Alphaproteobacteria bacterium]
MRAALGLARRGLGRVWPNPAVGCVIVRNGHIIGRGWTQAGGRPHAETEALSRAGAGARDATAYVTLEPCSHWGKTPPCADALIQAGIRRVVGAVVDPDPRVAGSGLRRLRDAGIAVEHGVCEAEAAEINAGFFHRVRLGRPLVTLKLATSLDGRIATASGESRWITGAAARERGHLLRATHDAILVGTETALTDDPELTCRLGGMAARSPVRVVLDRRSRLPLHSRLITGARNARTWIVTAPSADPARQAALTAAGVEIIPLTAIDAGTFNLAGVLQALGARGVTRLLVEGGGRLAAALLVAGLVDRLAWFHAPVLLGGVGIPAIAVLGTDRLADAPRFERIASEPLGADTVAIFRASAP